MGKKAIFRKRNFNLINMLIAAAGMVVFMMTAIPVYGAVEQTAVVGTVAADWSSSAVSVVPVDLDTDPVNGLLAQTTSSITLSSFGRYFYLISQYGTNAVAKVDINTPDASDWQWSTEGEESDSNPWGIAFANPEKAYIIRYGSSKIWIVNPSAETEANFKIGELDLSAYDDGDGIPDMSGGVVANGKLFVIMQRLTWYLPTELKPYVAVFDVETDEEIDTGMGEGGLKGIPLDTKNPMTIQYLAENDTIYVQCPGAYPYGWTTAPEFEDDGGIVAIDPFDYSTTLVLDDGEGLGADLTWGTIAGMEIVSPTKGYFVAAYEYGTDTLYAFDPSADDPDDPNVTAIDDDERLQNKSIAGMESGIYSDMNGKLWICNQTDAEVIILDTTTDTVVDTVNTLLNPGKVVFTLSGFVEDDDNNNGIVDAQEVVGAADLDGDETDDVITDTYKFLQTEVGGAQIAMEATEDVNAVLTMVSIDAADALEDDAGDPPDEMPYGLLNFDLEVTPGATVTVTVYFSDDTELNNWYKYDEDNGWTDYTNNAVFGQTADGRTQVTLTLTDGGTGDADGVANGIIVDPSGPGRLKKNGGGGGGGCFIDTLF